MRFTVECDYPGCTQGQVGGAPCPKCKGTGTITIPEKKSILPALVLILIFVSAFLLFVIFHKN